MRRTVILKNIVGISLDHVRGGLRIHTRLHTWIETLTATRATKEHPRKPTDSKQVQNRKDSVQDQFPFHRQVVTGTGNATNALQDEIYVQADHFRAPQTRYVTDRKDVTIPKASNDLPTSPSSSGNSRCRSSRGLDQLQVIPRNGDANAGIHEVGLHKILREDLEAVIEALLEDLGQKYAAVAANAVGDGVNAQHGAGDLRRDGVLHAVEVGALVVGRLFLQVRQVALEFRVRQVGVDPVVLQVGGAPERGAWRGGRVLAGAPDEEDALGEERAERGREEVGVLGDEVVAELLDEPFVEPGRVFVAELGADLEDDELARCLGQEAFQVVDDDVHEVALEDAVADFALLLHADVHHAHADAELVVDGELLALREGAGNGGQADLVGGGVVRARPHHVAHLKIFQRQRGHPFLRVGAVIVAPRERRLPW